MDINNKNNSTFLKEFLYTKNILFDIVTIMDAKQENTNSIEQQINKLIDEINHHNKLYFTDNSPSISDIEYDKLINKLKALEKDYPHLASPNSPTKNIGSSLITSLPKIAHQTPMLSINNVYSLDDLNSFFKRINSHFDKIPFVLEPKIDGLAISIIYKNKNLHKAITRGDGKTGNDVTQNVLTIKSIPKTINLSSKIEVRGEIFFPKKDFERFKAGFKKQTTFDFFSQSQKEINKKIFPNARNAASGSMLLSEPRLVAQRPLSALFYTLIVKEADKNINLKDHSKRLALLKDLGFKVNDFKVFENRKEIEEYILHFETIKDKLDFETDGLVIKLDSIEKQNILGFDTKYPKWAIAYKYQALKKQTIIDSIELSVGSSGDITPIALVEPVEISNTHVSRVSLHNFGEVIRKDIRLGDYILLEKSGEIIPKVHKVLYKKRKESAPINIPTRCPSCDETLYDNISIKIRCSKCLKLDIEFKYKGYAKDKYNDTLFPLFVKSVLFERKASLENIICPYCDSVALDNTILYNTTCVNMFCIKKITRQIINFVQRDALNIDALGKKTIKLLVDKELIKDYADIFYLTKENLTIDAGLSEKIAHKILENISKSKKTPLNLLIKGLGIPRIGTKQSNMLAKEYKSLEKIMKADEKSLFLCIGNKAGQEIKSFFSHKKNIELIKKLKMAGVKLND